MENNFENITATARTVPKKNTAKPIDLNLNIQNNSEPEEGLNFSEIITILKQGFPKIIAITLAALIIGGICATVFQFLTSEYSGEVSGIISFNYDGAELGLDPRGSSLSVEKIKSASVISGALDELGLSDRGVTVEDIRQHITINGIVPKDAMDQILIISEIATKDPTKLEQLPSLSYISTEYLITFNVPKKISALKNGKSVEFLDALLRSYEKYFFDEYGDRNVLNSIVFSDVSEYDYSEITTVFKTQIDNMISYIQGKREASPNFRSVATKMSFGDIAANLQLIKNIDIARFNAIVESKLLTRNINQLIITYQYSVIQKTLEMEIQNENALIARETLDKYTRGTTTVVGNDQSSTTQFEQSSEVYDSLTKQVTTALEASKRLQSEIDYLNTKINELQTSDLIPNLPADLEAAEEAIVKIIEKLDAWINITNETVDEYIESEALNESTKVLLTPQYKSLFFKGIKTIAMITAVFTLTGFICGVSYVFLRQLGKRDDAVFEY